MDEYVYFLGIDWGHLLAEKYTAPYLPDHPHHLLAPTNADFSLKYQSQTIPAPHIPDSFPGLFNDFYYLPPNAPWA